MKTTKGWWAAGVAGIVAWAVVAAVPSPPGRSVPMGPIGSRIFSAAGYDARHAVLTLVFRNGYTYEYLGVPPRIAEEFLESRNQGGYFNENIRYQHTAIRLGCPPAAPNAAGK